MTKITNIKNITKFKRSVKAISPVIATLLMISIAVVASLVVYSWVNGYMGFQTEKTGKAIAIPSFALDAEKNMVIYIQNVGQGDVKLGAIYIDDKIVRSLNNDVREGETVAVEVTGPYDSSQSYDIKVTTNDGISITATGRPGTGGTAPNPTSNPTATPTPTAPPVTQYTITVTDVANGNIEPNTGQHAAGSTPTFTITPNSGYRIASITVNGNPATVTTPSGQNYQFAALTTDASITATYEVIPPTQYTITVTDTVNGDISPNTASYIAGSTPSFTITPNAGYHIASINVNGDAVTVTTPSGQSYQFSALSADGTITATYAANTPITLTLRPSGKGAIEQLDETYSTLDNWQCIEEVTSDGDSYYIYDGEDWNGYDTDTYITENHGSVTGVISKVEVFINSRKDGTSSGVSYARTVIRIGGNYYYGVGNALGSSYASYSTVYTNDPSGGVWTWSDIDALEIGVSLDSDDTNGGSQSVARCTQVWVIVTYTP